MAPKKRGSDGEEKKAKSNTSSVSSRVTRSSGRRLKVKSAADSSELPRTKKAKTSSYKADQGQGKSGKESKIIAEGAAAKITVDGDDGSVTRTIVIEHCKQCNSFKTRAIQVKNGLENGLSGISVLINPEKPRRGCFEIREESGEKFISLLDMKRPFTPMKALDMDKVISDIIDKIK